MRQAAEDVLAATTNAEQLASIREIVAGDVRSSMRAEAISQPLVVQRAEGDRIWDVEGQRVVRPYHGRGSLPVFECADPELSAALPQQLKEGSMTGLPHRVDQEAEKLVSSVEHARFANLGTEAVAYAPHLVRAQQRGAYFYPSPIEPRFPSTAHSAEVLDHVMAVERDALDTVPEPQ